MAVLTPYPFSGLARRTLRELERDGAVFDLPRERFFLGDPGRDLAVRFHGRRAASPLGPSAGPHTQMAQNLVLSWLGGSRVLELKTVQVRDDLEIPRPCIDMRTVGLNAEWSQELRIEESRAEYVKGAMLIEMLLGSGLLEVAPGFGDTLYDLSVGYDLAGIRSDPMRGFIAGVLDASDLVERLRREIPAELAHLRDLPFSRRLAESVTLSTFHGCPPQEIEGILEHLMDEHGLNCVVKLNPMLLGAEETRALLHDALGYTDLTVPDRAFARDATWEEAVGFVERLRRHAARCGLGFGVKLTNTLIVENDGGFLPASEPEVYLSGPPLHVLAMHLVRRFRRHFGGSLPISFSAGIDRVTFADAVALGLVPITVSTDLLKKGGYGRLAGYYAALARRMDEVGARTVDELVLLGFGHAEKALGRAGAEGRALERCRAALAAGDDLRAAAGEALFARWLDEAKVANTETYVAGLAGDARFARAANAKPPRKIGRHLRLFDCLTCDLCIPVCPNDANFRLDLGREPIPVVRLRRRADGFDWHEEAALELAERHQIATFADFCNECGNCDVFCPEDGGPYAVKPRFFRRRQDWEGAPALDGFQVERRSDGDRIHGRFSGRTFALAVRDGTARFSGEGFTVHFAVDDPRGTVEADGADDIDLTYAFLLDRLRRAVLDGAPANYVNSLAPSGDPAR